MNDKNPTVEDILIAYAKEHGYDGLVDVFGDCGCEIDNLAPCISEGILTCRFGYKVPCTCGEGCDFHISTVKPVADEPSPTDEHEWRMKI